MPGMISGLPLEGSSSNGFVDFRRSVSVPALAKERKLATQALMRATERGNVQALRRLALEAGAEMTGCRALNRLGNDPVALLNSSLHLTMEEQRRIRRQFAQLPELAVAADAARAAGTAKATSRVGSKCSVAATEVSYVSSPPARAGPRGSASSPQLPASASASSTGQQARMSRAQLALTGLAATVGPTMQDKVCQAALADPRLLRAPQELSTQALQAIGRTLQSEELALKAVTRNPSLLGVEALKFKKVLPVLSGILGGHEEAAYAIAVQPELLNVERPQQMREALRTLSDCLCSMKDALWLIVQTMMPPSIQVSATAWTHEDVVGEYRRMEGREVNERPLYLKPAYSMKHLGDKAKDMYLRYSTQAADGSGGWFITSTPCGKPRHEPRTSLKAVGAVPARMNEEDRSATALAASTRTSPDQVPAGMWSFRHTETKAWTPDSSVVVADAGRPRSPGVLMVEPLQLRQTFDLAKEALGICWREPDVHGQPPEDVHLASCAVAGDATHIGGSGRFKSVGAFTQDTSGYVFLQLSADRKADIETTVRLSAWEPICVTVLYCGKTEDEQAPPVEEAPVARTNSKDKGAKGKDKGKGKKEEVEAEPAVTPEPEDPHVLKLEGAGFRAPGVVPVLPELEGLPPVKDVLSRCFPPGKVEFPLPPGPGKLKLAPLVFVRSQVCGQSGLSGAPCEVAKAKAGEPLLLANSEERRRSMGGEAAEAAPAAAGEGGPAALQPQGPLLQSAGELGYGGYNFLRAPGQGSCEPSEVLLRVDTGDRIQVIFAQFRLPPKATEAEAEDATQAAEAQEQPRPAPPPSAPPDWVKSEGWHLHDCKIPLTISTEQGEQVTAELVYEKTFEAGAHFDLHGSGQEVLSIAFFRRVGDPRPDPLRTVLLKKPSLLATGDRVGDLFQHVRVELGEAFARQALMTNLGEWPGLCVNGDAAAIGRWVHGQKANVLTREVQGVDWAKMLREQPDVASATAVQIKERCSALREVLGGSAAVREMLARQPQLLASEGSVFGASHSVLSLVVGQAVAQQTLRSRPEFLVRGPEVAGLFAKLRERFPDCAEQRLRERGSGEWARWPEHVGKSKEALHDWMGRLSAEERAARCQDLSQAPSAAKRSLPP